MHLARVSLFRLKAYNWSLDLRPPRRWSITSDEHAATLGARGPCVTDVRRTFAQRHRTLDLVHLHASRKGQLPCGPPEARLERHPAGRPYDLRLLALGLPPVRATAEALASGHAGAAGGAALGFVLAAGRAAASGSSLDELLSWAPYVAGVSAHGALSLGIAVGLWQLALCAREVQRRRFVSCLADWLARVDHERPPLGDVQLQGWDRLCVHAHVAGPQFTQALTDVAAGLRRTGMRVPIP